MSIEQLLGQIASLQAQRDDLSSQYEDLARRHDSLQKEAQALKTENQVLTGENDVLMHRISELIRQLALATRTEEQLALQFEINQLQKRFDAKNEEVFGKKSERRPPEPPQPPEKKKREKKPGHGPRSQKNLPRIEQIHLLDDADQICPGCGAGLHPWEGQFEESEEITLRRRTYEVIRHKRQKYKCACCSHIDTALGPTRLIPGGRYSVDFAIQVALDKYQDHLPLARQVARMQQAGLEVTTATLWDQLQALYVLFVPILLALHARILESELVFADETTWPVLQPGKTKKWWVWLVRNDTAVYFLIVPSRGREAGRQLLQDYAGIVMADDYGVYSALEGERTRLGGKQRLLLVDGEKVEVATPDYTLVTCWSHLRRYFFKAEKAGEKDAAVALDLIAVLYQVETQAHAEAQPRGGLLEARRQLRAARSAEVIEKLRVWCATHPAAPSSQLAAAIAHLQRVWLRAVVFLTDPRVPLDNNPAERSGRSVVLGRKTHQGSRSEAGTRVAALFYALIQTCQMEGVEPGDYFREAARRLQQDRKTIFLPSDFRALRQQAADPPHPEF